MDEKQSTWKEGMLTGCWHESEEQVPKSYKTRGAFPRPRPHVAIDQITASYDSRGQYAGRRQADEGEGNAQARYNDFSTALPAQTERHNRGDLSDWLGCREAEARFWERPQSHRPQRRWQECPHLA